MTAQPGTRALEGLRVLLVGNYAADEQHSMRLFAQTLHGELRQLGVEADLVEPPVASARLLPGKLGGYLDKYALFPPMLRQLARRYDVVHITDQSNAPYRATAAGRPVVVTCHDLFAVQIMLGEVPGERFGAKGRFLQRQVLGNLRRVQAFTSVSATSAAELRRITGTAAPIELIPNALLPVFQPTSDAAGRSPVLQMGLANAPFFLHVGGNQFYKNRAGVVRLFEKLTDMPAFVHHRLVLAGKSPDEPLAAAIASSRARARIDVRVTPSDEEVRALYRRATALLFISLREGFGWPILEAQACGCPVVTSDIEPMRSVAGGAAVLVDPADLAQAAERVAAAGSRFGKLREAGFTNAAEYTPSRIFPRYRDLYAKIASAPASAIAERR